MYNYKINVNKKTEISEQYTDVHCTKTSVTKFRLFIF